MPVSKRGALALTVVTAWLLRAHGVQVIAFGEGIIAVKGSNLWSNLVGHQMSWKCRLGVEKAETGVSEPRLEPCPCDVSINLW